MREDVSCPENINAVVFLLHKPVGLGRPQNVITAEHMLFYDLICIVDSGVTGYKVDLVYTKYMKALISYEEIQRIEQFMFHQDAFREILLNAIVHKDYSGCNPVQISVYDICLRKLQEI